MKKLITVAALLGAVSLSQGQLVDFENFNCSPIYTNSVHDGPATGLLTGDHANYVALFAAPTNQGAVNSSHAGWNLESTQTKSVKEWGKYVSHHC